MQLIFNKLLINLLACGLILTSSLDANALVRMAATSSGTANGTLKKKPLGFDQQVDQKWTLYTSKENGFSVELPKAPDHTHQKIDIPKTELSIEYDTYVSEPSDSVVYVVSVWHYPSEVDMSKPEVNLQDGFGGMLSALPGSQVLDMHISEVQGFKALEFLVKNDNIYFQGRLILVYNTLYQVFTVYKDSEHMTDNYLYFANSFQLINPEKNKLEKKNGSTIRKLNV